MKIKKIDRRLDEIQSLQLEESSMVENIKLRSGISPRALSTLETSKRFQTKDTSRLMTVSREEKDSLKPLTSFKNKRSSMVP